MSKATSLITDSITSAYLPVVDQMAFGQRLDPDQYQIQVKFKPLLQKATADALGTNPYPKNPTYPPISAALENTGHLFNVSTEVLGGFVWDAEVGKYKRGDEQLTYNIGSDANPLNSWYASAPHDADGFATYSVPLTSPSFASRGFYYGFGSGQIRTDDVVTNGGRVTNPDGTYSDVVVGFGPNYQQFGGGPADPGHPNSKLNTPNGIAQLWFGAPSNATGLSLEIKSIAVTRINANPIIARIDANSSVTFRPGTGFTYGTTQPPINVNGKVYSPTATNQISRFDQNGMTNLIFNERTPDDPSEVDRFLVRGAPEPLATAGTTFVDATNAVVNIRARLTQALANAGVAQSLTIYARDRQGNDTASGKGADEWDYHL